MVIRDVCPQCKSPKYKKNGHIHNGKQNHHCHNCGRQFVQCFEQYLIAEDKRRLIERLLLERLSLRGICRAVGVTLKWLLGFLVQCFAALPGHLHVQPVSCQHDVLIQRLEVEADEMASFVHSTSAHRYQGSCPGRSSHHQSGARLATPSMRQGKAMTDFFRHCQVVGDDMVTRQQQARSRHDCHRPDA